MVSPSEYFIETSSMHPDSHPSMDLFITFTRLRTQFRPPFAPSLARLSNPQLRCQHLHGCLVLQFAAHFCILLLNSCSFGLRYLGELERGRGEGERGSRLFRTSVESGAVRRRGHLPFLQKGNLRALPFRIASCGQAFWEVAQLGSDRAGEGGTWPRLQQDCVPRSGFQIPSNLMNREYPWLQAGLQIPYGLECALSNFWPAHAVRIVHAESQRNSPR